MSMFNRQPVLPAATPNRQRLSTADAPGSARPTPPQPLGHFAIVGVDQHTGEPVSTVIEARSEDDAQRIAQRQGIHVDEFRPMHPLAGVAAAKLARDDPHDRFNRPSPRVEDACGEGAAGVGRGGEAGVGRPLMHDTEMSRRGAKAARGPAGTAGVLLVLLAAGAVFYFTAVRDGGLRQLTVSLLPGPQHVHAAAIDVDQPLGVDLAAVQGFEDWQYVDDLDTPSAIRGSSHAGETSPPRRLRLEATVPATRAGGGHRGAAVIGGRILHPGHEIAGYRLVLVRDRHVLLQQGDRLIALRMATDP